MTTKANTALAALHVGTEHDAVATIEQNWDAGLTLLKFSDGSVLAIAGGDMAAFNPRCLADIEAYTAWIEAFAEGCGIDQEGEISNATEQARVAAWAKALGLDNTNDPEDNEEV